MASMAWRNGIAYAIWWTKAEVDGRPKWKQKRRSLQTRNPGLARQRLRLIEDELASRRWGGTPQISFRDGVRAWVADHFPNLRPKAALRYEVSLVHLRAVLDDVAIAAIGSKELLEFETARRAANVSAPTIRRDLACLSSFMSYAVEREWVDANSVPAFMRRRRRHGLKESPPRTRYFSLEEEAKILAHTNPPGAPFMVAADAIIFAIETGLRCEEQFSARWRQVRWGGEPSFLVEDGKGGKPREMPLTPRAMEVLTRCTRGESNDFIFAHEDGARFVQLDKSFRGACRRAGVLDVRWHDLRRTCGCRLLQERGFSMEQVRTWLGHESIKTTEKHYAFLNIRHLQRAVRDTEDRVVALPASGKRSWAA